MEWKTRIDGLLASGETVETIASEMGVTPNAVREIVAGRTRSPRADAAVLLLEFCRKHKSAIGRTKVTEKAA